MSDPADDGFLQRWSRRKAQVRRGAVAEPDPAPPAPSPVVAKAAVPVPVAAKAAVPEPLAAREAARAADVQAPSTPPPEPDAPSRPAPPTMEDVARLTRDSDYSRFVGAGVDPAVSNAAMRTLFRDPRFNVMDGLDVYIDDYGKPDPIPDSMLRQLNQSKLLRLFEVADNAEPPPGEAAAAASPDGPESPQVAQSPGAPVPPPLPDDDPDLRLQQDDAPGRPGAGPDPRA